MSKDPFDIFKEGLQDYQPTEVPSRLSWEKNAKVIQNALALEKKKKRRPFWLFLCFLFMGFIGISSAYLLTSNPPSQESQISANPSEQPPSKKDLLIESPISESLVSRSPKEKIEEANSMFTAHALSPNNEVLTLIPINRDSAKSISTPIASSII
ncbi:MAG: hypothetical protein AAFR66_23915, partial [Bacteroidota bacterium]